MWWGRDQVLLPEGWGREMVNGIRLRGLPRPRTARSVGQKQDKVIPRPGWVLPPSHEPCRAA